MNLNQDIVIPSKAKNLIFYIKNRKQIDGNGIKIPIKSEKKKEFQG